jgi:hypothetical protein
MIMSFSIIERSGTAVMAWILWVALAGDYIYIYILVHALWQVLFESLKDMSFLASSYVKGLHFIFLR